jgi:hypothetical protein
MVSDSNPPQPESIVVGSGVARVRRLGRGDVMTFRAYDGGIALYEVQDILPSASELISSDLVIMERGDFHALFAFPEIPAPYSRARS